MADMARIKRNVAKMVGMGAPEADIDAYIAQEGTSVAEVQAYKAGPIQLQGKVQPQAARPTEGSTNVVDARPAPRTDLMTATANTISGITNAIPILGPLSQGIMDNVGGHISQAMGGDFNAPVQRREELIARDPVAYGAGNLGGALASFGAAGATKLGAEALGLTGKMLPGVVKAAASNQGLYTADQFARGEAGLDTLGGGLPAVLGAGGRVAGDAIGAGGQKISDALTGAAQRKVTTAAIKGAPSAADLKAASSALFKQVDQSGVTVDPQRFTTFVADMVQKAVKDRMNPTLDPKSYAAFLEIARAANGGGSLTVSDLHTLRQIVQKAAQSAEGRDAMFASRMIEGLDNFVTQSGNLSGGQSGKTLMEAISTWGRARRVGMIEEAVTKAQTYQSGFENGLRLQFQSLLKNPKTRKMFTDAERQAIEEVAKGTALSNVVRVLGKFGFGPNNMLGGTIGASIGGTFGGIPGALATAAISGGARKVSEKMGEAAANRAAQVVATPGIRSVPKLPNMMLPARRPVDYVIRSEGGLLSQ